MSSGYSLCLRKFLQRGEYGLLGCLLSWKRASNNANVIFKDLMVIVNIYQENSFIQKNDSNNNKPMMTVNIPFNSSQLGLYDVISKSRKFWILRVWIIIWWWKVTCKEGLVWKTIYNFRWRKVKLCNSPGKGIARPIYRKYLTALKNDIDASQKCDQKVRHVQSVRIL